MARHHSSNAIEIGGMHDHVHILLTLPRTTSLAKLVELLKSASSKWLKTKNESLKQFGWQDGYGVFSVSASKVESVRRYIAQQEIHHQKTSFQNELRLLLNKNGVEFNEQYLWD